MTQHTGLGSSSSQHAFIWKWVSLASGESSCVPPAMDGFRPFHHAPMVNIPKSTWGSCKRKNCLAVCGLLELVWAWRASPVLWKRTKDHCRNAFPGYGGRRHCCPLTPCLLLLGRSLLFGRAVLEPKRAWGSKYGRGKTSTWRKSLELDMSRYWQYKAE